jgi:hypothetical protein
VGDISCIHTSEGWLFLAVVTSLYSRQVVGWSLREDMTREIVIDALRMAWFKRHLSKVSALMFHSDRGRQYASQGLRGLLKDPGITASMSWRGDCWERQRLQRDGVRIAEGRAAAWTGLRDQTPGQGRSHRLAALAQQDSVALDAGLCQPDEVRAKLAGQSTQASQFVTRSWGADSRDKVIRPWPTVWVGVVLEVLGSL